MAIDGVMMLDGAMGLGRAMESIVGMVLDGATLVDRAMWIVEVM